MFFSQLVLIDMKLDLVVFICLALSSVISHESVEKNNIGSKYSVWQPGRKRTALTAATKT